MPAAANTSAPDPHKTHPLCRDMPWHVRPLIKPYQTYKTYKTYKIYKIYKIYNHLIL